MDRNVASAAASYQAIGSGRSSPPSTTQEQNSELNPRVLMKGEDTFPECHTNQPILNPLSKEIEEPLLVDRDAATHNGEKEIII